MITSAILVLLYLLLKLIILPITLLPDVSLPAGISSAIATASSYFAVISEILPDTVTSLLVVLGVVLGIDAVIFLYKIIIWVIRKIPTIG